MRAPRCRKLLASSPCTLADTSVASRFAPRSYVEIPSDNVPFNTTPAMKAPEITAAGIEALRSKKYDVRAP